jgi:transglutaminase-like putative cysteine protease
LSDSSVVRLGHPLSRGFHYDAWSLLDPPPETASPLYPPPVLPLQQRQRYLQLPALDPRIPALARDFAGDAPSDMARARAIERHLRRDYTYTLDLPDRKTSDPLADFLFTRKRGYCEYFASALAVMLRSQGIPARLATGFQSGVFNPVSGLWLVRASDAHSWVEAWIPGHGWCIFDPTPPDLNPGGLTLLTRLALYLDAADTFWREWVVTYDLTRQGTLAFRLEQQLRLMGSHWTDGLRSWRSAPAWRSGAWLPAPWLKTPGRLGGIAFAWLAGMAAIGFGARHAMRWLVLRRRLKRLNRGHASVADATLLYHRMLDLLGKRGYQKPPWLTPAEFARGLPATPLGAAVGEFTAAYNALRFGGQAAAARKLSTLLERLDRA